MSKSNTFETALLELIFKNTNMANVGDATGVRGATTPGNLYFSLHTADPGEAGDQSTSEVTYTSYARVGVARSAVGFTVSGNQVTPAAPVSFPQGTGGGGTATHWAVGTAASGAGSVLYKGAMTPSIALGLGITPIINPTITED